MTNEAVISEPLLVLLGSALTMVAGGIVWICKNRCRNQTVDCDSGCCRFHSDSRLRDTIRQEVRVEMQKSSASGSESVDLEKATD